jgi:hypothetical protein
MKTRLFAPFRNKEDQQRSFEELLVNIPKTRQWYLMMYLGQMESTIVEGYTDDI